MQTLILLQSYEVLISLLIQTYKFLMISVNLCKFLTHCLDVLADKPHPRFLRKVLSKKVRLICRCLRYLPMLCTVVSLYNYAALDQNMRKI